MQLLELVDCAMNAKNAILESLARSRERLRAAHDYYEHTVAVWRITDGRVRAGDTFSINNLLTGTTVDQHQLMELMRDYVLKNLNPSTFQQFLSIFEDFFFEILRVWLRCYPGSLSEKMLKFNAVLSATDRESIIDSIIDREINEVKYQRVADWFEYFNRLAKLGCPAADEIERLAECKASRDLIAHNQGIVNSVYLSKAGKCSRYKVNEFLEIPDDYHRETWQLVHKMIGDLGLALEPKLPLA